MTNDSVDHERILMQLEGIHEAEPRLLKNPGRIQRESGGGWAKGRGGGLGC